MRPFIKQRLMKKIQHNSVKARDYSNRGGMSFKKHR